MADNAFQTILRDSILSKIDDFEGGKLKEEMFKVSLDNLVLASKELQKQVKLIDLGDGVQLQAVYVPNEIQLISKNQDSSDPKVTSTGTIVCFLSREPDGVVTILCPGTMKNSLIGSKRWMVCLIIYRGLLLIR
jgi:hypothetical protein